MNHPQCCNAAPLMNTGPTDWAVHALLRSLIALENRIQLSSTLSLQRNNNLCLPLKNFSSPSPHLRDTHGTPPNPPSPLTDLGPWPRNLSSLWALPQLFLSHRSDVIHVLFWSSLSEQLHSTRPTSFSSAAAGTGNTEGTIYLLRYIHVQYISIYIWIYLYLYIHVRPWAYYICARNVLHMNKQYMYIHKYINI